MSILETIEKPKAKPLICTISGDAGRGKTSLAATFPKPIFIRAEDGMQAIPEDRRPDAFPLLTSVDQLFDQLIGLLKEEHDYKTLVIDSVTKLETMFIEHIVAQDGKARSINQAGGGYGAGPNMVAALHGRVRKAAGLLAEKRGMNIIFIAHADVETMKLPDQDDYQRYSLRLMPKSLPPYVDDVDLVGFVRLATIIRGEDGERKKAVTNGDRELIVAASPATVTKNRFGLSEVIELPEGENPLAKLIQGV